MTETTKITEILEPSGWILFDADCRLCAALARRFARPLGRRGFRFAPVQSPWVAARLRLPQDALLSEMRLLTVDGLVLGGADAIAEIARAVWWGWPVSIAARIPLGLKVLRIVYRWIAARRSCRGGLCKTPRRRPLAAWLPLVLFPISIALLRTRLPAWAVMWALAAGIFAGCKWLTWRVNYGNAARAGWRRTFAWFTLWPGMDAAFFDSEVRVPKPAARSWAFAFCKILFGVVLLWSGARMVPAQHPVLAGWAGMLGTIFVLHFGAFHLVALWWQARGVNAELIMRFPALATSVGEFWSARWNRGFNDLARRFVFQPLQPRLGVAGATLASFLASGLVHEMVISFPARGGYGLPTFYFLIQALGALIQRSSLGKKLNLRRGWRGWLFTCAVVVAPVGWLFHPRFVRRVIIPFLVVIGAL